MDRVYGPTPSPYVRFLHDAPDVERLEFHIRSGDYFALLATALGFLEETLGECDGHAALAADHKKLVTDLRENLRYLHQNYDIQKRATPLSAPHKGLRVFS